MGRKFVLGDLHGGYQGLKQVFDKSKFDYNNDSLIFLGDSLDGWSEHDKIIDEFLKIKNFRFIMGNHDHVFLEWLETGQHPFSWGHGGVGVIKAYERLHRKSYNIRKSGFNYTTTLKPFNIPDHHVAFYKSAITHYLDSDGRLFLHAGFDRQYTLESHFPELSRDVFAWDGSILKDAITAHRQGGSIKFGEADVKRVYVGHTPVNNYGYDAPFVGMNLIGMDTGAAFKGKVSLMDYEKLQIFQSDEVWKLYPRERGRNSMSYNDFKNINGGRGMSL